MLFIRRLCHANEIYYELFSRLKLALQELCMVMCSTSCTSCVTIKRREHYVIWNPVGHQYTEINTNNINQHGTKDMKTCNWTTRTAPTTTGSIKVLRKGVYYNFCYKPSHNSNVEMTTTNLTYPCSFVTWIFRSS